MWKKVEIERAETMEYAHYDISLYKCLIYLVKSAIS